MMGKPTYEYPGGGAVVEVPLAVVMAASASMRAKPTPYSGAQTRCM